MHRVSSVLILVLIVACLATALIAQAESKGSESSDPSIAAKIESLLAMPAKERRAYLKALAPDERRGLWMKVKQAQVKSRGGEKAVYKDLEGFEVDGPGFKSAGSLPTKAAVGTVVYDSGFPERAFGGGQLVGNHFNTHTGIPMCNPGTISTVQAIVVPGQINTTSSAGFVILGPQTTVMASGGAPALFSTFTGASGVIDSVAFAGLGVTYTGSDFFVVFGDFASAYIPVVGTGTNLGQGGHAVVGYTGGVTTSVTRTFNFGQVYNSFVRVTGVIVPVELMTFDTE